MSLTVIIAQDRRVAILLTLTEAAGFVLNEDALKLVLHSQGTVVSTDVLRGDLSWLEQQALVRTEKLAVAFGELWIAHLLPLGVDVARGVQFPGVARPRAH
jgi:hypothetical protein